MALYLYLSFLCCSTAMPDRFSHIACGPHHSLAVTTSGRLFTWGDNRNGKLGHGHNRPELLPRLVDSLATAGTRVVQAAGGADISICLDVAGRVFTWGWSASGRLGRGGYGDEMMPGVVSKLAGVRIVRVRLQ